MHRKREFLLAVAILVISTLAYIFGWTEIFTVQKITVTGTSDAAIISKVINLADVQRGEKLARIEPRQISAKLVGAGIDWIDSIKVSRNWITRSVDIRLTARNPIAMAGEKYLDSTGKLFSSPVKVTAQLIQISAKDQAGRAAAISFYQGLAPDFQSQLTKLIAVTSENFQLLTKDKLRIIWGSNSNNELKIKIYSALIALPENSKIKLMDLSDPNKPTVR